MVKAQSTLPSIFWSWEIHKLEWHQVTAWGISIGFLILLLLLSSRRPQQWATEGTWEDFKGPTSLPVLSEEDKSPKSELLQHTWKFLVHQIFIHILQCLFGLLHNPRDLFCALNTSFPCISTDICSCFFIWPTVRHHPNFMTAPCIVSLLFPIWKFCERQRTGLRGDVWEVREWGWGMGQTKGPSKQDFHW